MFAKDQDDFLKCLFLSTTQKYSVYSYRAVRETRNNMQLDILCLKNYSYQLIHYQNSW